MIMFLAYTKIFYVLNCRKGLNDKQTIPISLKSRHLRGIRQSYKKTAITSLIIVGTYVICWLPGVMYNILSCIDGCQFTLTKQSSNNRLILGFISNGLIILKAIVDPFIYSYRMKEIKMAIKSFLTGIPKQSDCLELKITRSWHLGTTNNSFI